MGIGGVVVVVVGGGGEVVVVDDVRAVEGGEYLGELVGGTPAA